MAIIKLVQTCPACPEQYNAYHNDQQIGYFRLRHGYFRVDSPECGDTTIYEGYPKGDGEFHNSNERHMFLKNGCKKLAAYNGFAYEGYEIVGKL